MYMINNKEHLMKDKNYQDLRSNINFKKHIKNLVKHSTTFFL